MREILFRGQGITGKWYEGHYMTLSETTFCFAEDYAAHPDNTKHYIVFDRMIDWGLPNEHWKVRIDPETLGQYAGLTDKNGKRIFEGDIVKIPDDYDEFGKHAGEKYEVTFDFGGCRLKPKNRRDARRFWLENGRMVEVIGNIHDNPELVEVANDAD